MGDVTHTPGPWRIADGDGGAILAPSPSGTADRYVQVIYFDGEKYIYLSPGDGPLIAAAPDMLALLQELIDIEGPQPGTHAWARKVQSVIARATAHASAK